MASTSVVSHGHTAKLVNGSEKHEELITTSTTSLANITAATTTTTATDKLYSVTRKRTYEQAMSQILTQATTSTEDGITQSPISTTATTTPVSLTTDTTVDEVNILQIYPVATKTTTPIPNNVDHTITKTTTHLDEKNSNGQETKPTNKIYTRTISDCEQDDLVLSKMTPAIEVVAAAAGAETETTKKNTTTTKNFNKNNGIPVTGSKQTDIDVESRPSSSKKYADKKYIPMYPTTSAAAVINSNDANYMVSTSWFMNTMTIYQPN